MRLWCYLIEVTELLIVFFSVIRPIKIIATVSFIFYRHLNLVGVSKVSAVSKIYQCPQDIHLLLVYLELDWTGR